MRRRHDVEAQLDRDPDEGVGEPTLRPKIRKKVEKLCELLDVDFQNLAELRILPNALFIVEYRRNEAGSFFRDNNGEPATRSRYLQADTESDDGEA